MAILRFLMLLSLVVWLGGIIFFASVAAPALFATLPTRHLAGTVVNRVLPMLHWIGIVCGVVFAFTSMLSARLSGSAAAPFAARHLLIYLMIILTLVSQLAIGSRMLGLKAQMGVIDDLPQNDPRRVEFNQLHHWSTRLEATVLVLGLAVLYLTARRLT